MTVVSDQIYLKTQQYRSGNNLDARIQLHRRFSTNPTNYFEWMVDQLELRPGMQVMEIGCGTGEIWHVNQQRLPTDLRVTLLDLSIGMVDTARSSSNGDERFNFATGDAQHLPFENGRFDTVLANYMLYHVPDIAQAVHELRRVLKPSGRLCAATNGRQHMQDLYDLMNRFSLEAAPMHSFTGRYGLENAPEILGKYFEQVEIVPFTDSLYITETQPLMDYIHSMIGIWNIPKDAETEMEKWIAAEIAAKGGFTIHKASGIVLAC